MCEHSLASLNEQQQHKHEIIKKKQKNNINIFVSQFYAGAFCFYEHVMLNVKFIYNGIR